MFVPETRSRRSWDVEMMRMKLPTARFRPKHRKKCVPRPLRLVLGRQRILQANWRELSSVLLGLATSRACYSSPVTQGSLSENARVTVICVSLVRHKVKELGCFKQARIGIILSTKCWITEEKPLRPSCSWWMLCHKLVFHRSDTCIVECRVSHTKGKRLGGGGSVVGRERQKEHMRRPGWTRSANVGCQPMGEGTAPTGRSDVAHVIFSIDQTAQQHKQKQRQSHSTQFSPSIISR